MADTDNVLYLDGAPVNLDNTLDVDVTPADLLNLEETYLGPFLSEVDRQWPQGRDAGGNGRGSRIGTIEVYFDHKDVLHMHFRERGSYVLREGALTEIPVGNLSSYNIGPVFNVSGSGSSRVGELLVSLPPDVDPNDPKWDLIAELLSAMSAEK